MNYSSAAQHEAQVGVLAGLVVVAGSRWRPVATRKGQVDMDNAVKRTTSPATTIRVKSE